MKVASSEVNSIITVNKATGVTHVEETYPDGTKKVFDFNRNDAPKAPKVSQKASNGISV